VYLDRMQDDVREKEPLARRIDVGDVTLAWGDRSRWKAELRSESARRHLELPLPERLRAALRLVVPRRAPR
jgi:hypothetical protein